MPNLAVPEALDVDARAAALAIGAQILRSPAVTVRGAGRDVVVHAAIAGPQPLRVDLTGATTREPLVSELSRQFGLDLNIVAGRIDEIQGHPFGSLAVIASGPAAAIEEAVNHLRLRDVHVEVLGHVPTDDRTDP